MIGRVASILVAVAALAIVPAASGEARADAGLRVWATNIVASDDEASPAESAGGAGTLRIAAARNGSFSAKILVAGESGIEELSAEAGELRCGDAAIGAGQVRIRYGAAWEGLGGFVRPRGLDVLLPTAPAGQKRAAVWVTVTVPREAPAGVYTGAVTVRAKGAPPVSVPVELSVADWALPDPQDYRTWVELIQSPDTLAVEYNVPLWSDAHWRLIEESLKLFGPVGSRVVYVPLVCHTNLGNEQSMVRWIDKGEGRWEQDYSLMDRYLDAATRHMGRPKIVVFNIWDVYQQEKLLKKISGPAERREAEQKELTEHVGGLHAEHGFGPEVTTVDPATGVAGTAWLPALSEEASKAQWAPVFRELRRRMEARGLAGTMMLGMFTDVQPSKEVAAALKEVSGGLPWVCHAHFNPGDRLHDVADVGYRTVHEATVVTLNPALGRTYGWQAKQLVAEHYRAGLVFQMTTSEVRCLLELHITGGERGVGYIGGDLWPCIRGGRQNLRMGTVTDRYPESLWRNLEIRASLLGPGPDGAVATARYENLREGLQECEARIAVERALTDAALRERLGDELAGRAQALLDERQAALWKQRGLTDEEIRAHGSLKQWIRVLAYDSRSGKGTAGWKWFAESSWPTRTAALYAVAGEVAQELAAGDKAGRQPVPAP